MGEYISKFPKNFFQNFFQILYLRDYQGYFCQKVIYKEGDTGAYPPYIYPLPLHMGGFSYYTPNMIPSPPMMLLNGLLRKPNNVIN